jgi:primosomal protein N' (replication factor Y)
MAKFARVIVDQSGSRAFDYEVPEALANKVQIGSRVQVLVRARPALATVINLLDETSAPGVRPISDVISEKPLVNPQLIKLGYWMADYYCSSLEAALKTILPQVVRKAEVTYKTHLITGLLRDISKEEIAQLEKRAPKQADVLSFLKEKGASIPLAKLANEYGTSRQTVESLAKRGYVFIREETLQRDPHEDEEFLPTPQHELNAEQKNIFAKVRDVIRSSDAPKPILLHGVTGSGKTEIYLQAIELVLSLGKSAIVLVPEIALTPQTVERFKSRFSETQKQVAVLHSHLSAGERHDEWHKINNGQARIVIGARSAIFAPVQNLGLIVVDEEHENSYKQEETPRYHARDVAVVRASMEKCAILLGSATPSIESFYNAETNKYELLRLTQRVDQRKMPRIRIIDMRLESTKARAPTPLSETLCEAIRDRLKKREQCILFLNRRGFNTSLICSNCGYVCTCPNCSVALTFHRAANRVSCHMCGHQSVVPQKCPQCNDPRIKYSGAGTEKIEEAVARLFPDAVTRRMDADTMSRKEAYREVLHAFRTGRIDILVGTQMIAKGLHFPNVTLVGIVNADLALHLPDFRAGERTFQLLTQVAGRAGRGEIEGDVLVQTYTPFHPAIQFARHHDFDGFWQQEIEFRKQSSFPPYTHMVLITIRSPNEMKARFSADTLSRRLKEALEAMEAALKSKLVGKLSTSAQATTTSATTPSTSNATNQPTTITASDPAPAPIEKSRGNFRFHILLRTRAILKLTRTLREVLEKLTFPEDVVVTVDVDPYQLL